MEYAFEYYDKWLQIPDGEELDIGIAEITASAKAIKGKNKIKLQTGELIKCSETDIFKGHDPSLMHNAMMAIHGWEWFDPVRNEPFFAEYVKRAEKYLK